MEEKHKEGSAYTGTEVLENLKEAAHYNSALIGLAERTCRPGKDARILDFGAGIGTFAQLFYGKGLDIDCFEIDAAECKVLRSEGFQVFQDLDEVEDETYDLIYTYNVLEHIEDDVGTLRNLKEKLKPNGRLFIFVPAFQLLYSDLDRAVDHKRRYRKRTLRNVIERGGFGVIEMHYFDSIGFCAALVFKLMRSKHEDITKKKIIFFDRVVFPLNKILDPILTRFFGKNLYAVCKKRKVR